MKYRKESFFGFIALAILILPALAFGLSLEERVKEYSLDNGMRVLLLERRFAPVVSLYMRFKVGAVDEPGGETGTAHVLEHMLFKGTETLGTKSYKEEKKILEEIDRLSLKIDTEMKEGKDTDNNRIAEWREKLKALQQEHKKWVVKDEINALYSQNGAEGLNASTGYDVTTYKVSLPANRIELWARIESDRISNPVFREFYSEREVVREERRQREETQAGGKLMENFLATAFVAHNYGRPIIGWDSDLKYMKKEKVKQVFRNYYSPNNAVVAIVGDINPDEVMGTIEKYFGELPPQEIVYAPMSEEPEQSGERRVEVEFDANPRLIIGYHKPGLPHFDDYVFDVIDIILSEGRTSMLYKTLVEEKKLAVSVSTANGMPGGRYANLFTIYATPRSPHTCEELEKEIYKHLDGLKEKAVTAHELTKVKNRLEADFIRSLSSNAGLASQLSYYQVIAGDWRYLEKHLKVIESITPENIMQVAEKYLVKKNRTVAKIVRKEKEK
jgi:predicted Zn-dependent peptidase